MKNGNLLTRNTRDKWFAGVCAGIARYINWDVTWVRLVCIILFFLHWSFILLYLLLAFVLPADTAAGTEESIATDQTANATDRSSGNVFLGILLIATGIIFLAEEFFGWLGWEKLWPVLLIIIGIYLLTDSFRQNGKSPNHTLTDKLLETRYFDPNDTPPAHEDNEPGKPQA